MHRAFCAILAWSFLIALRWLKKSIQGQMHYLQIALLAFRSRTFREFRCVLRGPFFNNVYEIVVGSRERIRRYGDEYGDEYGGISGAVVLCQVEAKSIERIHVCKVSRKKVWWALSSNLFHQFQNAVLYTSTLDTIHNSGSNSTLECLINYG
jgi:hypothetical protein